MCWCNNYNHIRKCTEYHTLKLYCFFNLGPRSGWVVNAATRPPLPPVPIVQEAGWAPGPVWMGEEILAATGILFVFSSTLFVLHLHLFVCPDCPAFCLLSLLATHNTNNYAPGGIRTRNSSERSAAYLRLKQLGYRDSIFWTVQTVASRYTD